MDNSNTTHAVTSYSDRLEEDLENCIDQAKTWISEIGKCKYATSTELSAFQDGDDKVIIPSPSQIEVIKCIIEAYYKREIRDLKCSQHGAYIEFKKYTSDNAWFVYDYS